MILTLAVAAAGFFTSIKPPIYDAVIDQASPDANAGREFFSITGAGKALLIDNEDLRSVGRSNRKITTGSLTLTVLTGEPKVKSIRLISRPWHEGTGGQASVSPDPLGASWKAARKGSPWTSPGAMGDGDSTAVEGWSVESKSQKITITGLGGAFQRIAQGDPDARGLRIEFEGDGRLGSAELPTDGPQFQYETAPFEGANLQVELVDIPNRKLNAGEEVSGEVRVANHGSAPAAAASLSIEGAATPVAIPAVNAGETAVVQAPIRFQGSDSPWDQAVEIVLSGSSSSRLFNLFPNGISVKGTGAAQAVERLNGHVLPFSRFSFALGGVAERFREVGKGEADVALSGSPELTPLQEVLAKSTGWTGPALRPGDGLSPDTRDERLAIPGVPLPPLGWPSRFGEEAPLVESGLLGRYEAGALHLLAGVRGEARNAWKPNIAKSLVLRFFDLSGRPLEAEGLEVYGGQLEAQTGAKPLLKTRLMNTGGCFVSPGQFEPAGNTLFSQEDPLTKTIALKVGKPDNFEIIAISKREMIEDGLRGPAPVASFEIRVPLAKGAVDTETNAALNKAVEDSSGRFPAQLAALVDGNPATAVSVPGTPEGSNWIEVDLGRDRLTARIEIAFKGEMPRGIQIQTYGTSQGPSAANMWIRDLNTYLRGFKDGVAVYKGATMLMRYIRIAPLSGSETQISEVVVRPLAGLPDLPPPASR